MMGVGRVVGKGWGEALNRSFEQNRYRIIEFGYRHAHYETKSAEIAFFRGESQIFWGNPPVMTSRSRKNVTFSPEKSPKTRCAGDFTSLSMQEEAAILEK